MNTGRGIGLSDDHAQLVSSVRRWVADAGGARAARAATDGDPVPALTAWRSSVDAGWLGIGVSEAAGASGGGLLDAAVLVEALGHGCTAGPVVPSLAAAVVIDRCGGDELRSGVVSGLVGGDERGAVGVGTRAVAVRRSHDATLAVAGEWPTVLAGAGATVFVLPVTVDDDPAWLVLADDEVAVRPQPGIDASRPPAAVTADITVAQSRLLTGDVEDLAGLVFAAEAVGVAAWCVDAAAAHARERRQFGRPIGQFQAVKHRCADMAVAVEAARAATWDAAAAIDEQADGRRIAAANALALAPDAAYRCAKDCIQVLGGIGFTWEHDAHLYLKRAMATRAALGPASARRVRMAELARSGERRVVRVELDHAAADAVAFRDEVRGFLDDLSDRPRPEWNPRIADAGFLVPHWPEPWGRDAGPLQQLVIDDEFRRARVRRPHLAVGAWALPTIIVHGTDAQRQRFVWPTLRLEMTWCQMFSEPEAGSDLAALRTRARRVDGGWSLTGQKVWTSMAQSAHWGICLARTDPAAPKHDGIGCFLVDMSSDGLDIRPLRELTGAEMFNEVFLDDVFVPDDCVVGGVTDGWRVARTTLGSERVSMGSGASMGPGLEGLVASVPDGVFAAHAERIGSLVGAAHAVATLGVRATLRSLGGTDPAAEASIRKLLGVEHDQDVQEVGLDLLGPAALSGEGDAATWLGGFLGNRALSIAGGTSEIQRNVIAERLLGLPRDPEDPTLRTPR